MELPIIFFVPFPSVEQCMKALKILRRKDRNNILRCNQGLSRTNSTNVNKTMRFNYPDNVRTIVMFSSMPSPGPSGTSSNPSEMVRGSDRMGLSSLIEICSILYS